MTAHSNEELNAMPVEFKLNGKDVSAHPGETIIQAAKRHGVEIPHLCYKEGMRPDGNCRACVVEVKGERFHDWPYSKTCQEGPVYESCELSAL